MNSLCPMTRRAGGVVALAASLLLVLMSTAPAAPPSGPRLAVVSLRAPGWTQLFTVDQQGSDRRSLYALSQSKAPRAVYPYSAPSWSPDGKRIVFTALNEELPEFGRTGTSLVSISAGGGTVKPIPGTVNGYGPVFSPDGRTVAFARQQERHGRSGEENFESVSVWLADLRTGKSKPLTPWRNDVFLFPASFSPDGSRLAISRRVGDRPAEAVEIGLDGKLIRVLARKAYEPIYSPDGRSIALLRGPFKEVTRHFPPNGRLRLAAQMTDIFVIKASGGGWRRVTHTKRAAEEAPRWDPSGRRLAYTDWRPFDYGGESGHVQELVGYEFSKSIRVINADGTCPAPILSGLDSIHFAAVWQPGTRGAAPASC
jgi:Tol biopolymer transport system component